MQTVYVLFVFCEYYTYSTPKQQLVQQLVYWIYKKSWSSSKIILDLIQRSKNQNCLVGWYFRNFLIKPHNFFRVLVLIKQTLIKICMWFKIWCSAGNWKTWNFRFITVIIDNLSTSTLPFWTEICNIHVCLPLQSCRHGIILCASGS